MAYLDSRDLQERLEELQGMRDAYLDNPDVEVDLDESEQSELDELLDLSDEVSEWQYGATLIPENEFEDYARDFAEEIGTLPTDATWPLTCIDWQYAAKELAYDYSLVTYQGYNYYVRSC